MNPIRGLLTLGIKFCHRFGSLPHFKKFLIALFLGTSVTAGFLYSLYYMDHPVRVDSISNQTSATVVSLDGDYNANTQDPHTNFNVVITNSGGTKFDFDIIGWRSRREFNYSGTATRIASSSLAYRVLGSPSNPCTITFIFDKINQLKVYVDSLHSQDERIRDTCFEDITNLGYFTEDYTYVKDGALPVQQLQDLGYSATETARFTQLSPEVSEIEKFIIIPDNSENSNEWTRKLTSHDIPDGLVYTIGAATGYEADLAAAVCNFEKDEYMSAMRQGECSYAGLISNGTYQWVMVMPAGTGEFVYATNHPQWKKKLPDVFKRVLTELNLDETNVLDR